MASYALTADPHIVRNNVTGAAFDPASDVIEAREYADWLDAGGVPDPFIKPIGSTTYNWGPHFIDVIGRK